MTTADRIPGPMADRCEICGRALISRRVRLQGRCGVHQRQPVLPPASDSTHRPEEGTSR